MRLLITHNREDEDAHIEKADAKQLEVVLCLKGVGGKACEIDVAQNEYTEVRWHSI